MTKKISTLFLLAILSLPLCYPLVYKIHQHAIRHRMEQKLAKENLIHIELKMNEIIWVKPGKEILVQGRMFDIHSLKSDNNGTARITGLFDEEETALKKNLRDTQQQDSQNHKQLTWLFQQIQALPADCTSDHSKFAILSEYHLFNDKKFHQPYLKTPIPPPRT